jgi:hypothetical protein
MFRSTTYQHDGILDGGANGGAAAGKFIGGLPEELARFARRGDILGSGSPCVRHCNHEGGQEKQRKQQATHTVPGCHGVLLSRAGSARGFRLYWRF